MPRKSTKKTTKKTAAKKTTKGKKLDNLEQAHGKKEFKATTLDQIWGDEGLWRYKTTDAEEYSKQLDEMTLSDIQRHASKMGVIPSGSRILLTKKLVSEFKKHMSQYRFKSEPPKPTPELSDKAWKILKEGQ